MQIARHEKGYKCLSHQRVSHCIQRCLGGERAIEPRPALTTLLKGRDPYDVGSSAIAPFVYARVSLPESVHEAQLLAEQQLVADRCLLDCSGVLRLLAVEASLLELSGCHARLMMLCVEMGLTGFTLEGRGQVGISQIQNASLCDADWRGPVQY